MHIILKIIFLLYASIDKSDGFTIEVIDSGVMTVHKEDAAVFFFVTIHHQGHVPLRIKVNVVECCEKIGEDDLDDTDYDTIDLHGGDMGVIQPGSITNLTLVYPNVYGYNRRGSCLVDIAHSENGREISDEIRHRIDFDTRISPYSVPSALQGLYSPGQIRVCDTHDLDPFDYCNPVNCQLKYSGHRNYFNQKWRLCQKVPTCVADPAKRLPDVAYVPISNVCKDLDQAVTASEVGFLLQGTIENKPEEQAHAINARGSRPEKCICDSWTANQICNRCSYPPQPQNDYQVLPVVLGIVLACWLTTCVLCVEKYGYFCLKKKHECYQEPEVLYFPINDDYANKKSCMSNNKTSSSSY